MFWRLFTFVLHLLHTICAVLVLEELRQPFDRKYNYSFCIQWNYITLQFFILCLFFFFFFFLGGGGGGGGGGGILCFHPEEEMLEVFLGGFTTMKSVVTVPHSGQHHIINCASPRWLSARGHLMSQVSFFLHAILLHRSLLWVRLDAQVTLNEC